VDENTSTRSNKRLAIVLIISGAAAILTLFVAVQLFIVQPRERARQDAAFDALIEAMTPVDVLYEVEGTASGASVTMEKPDGTEQVDVDLPMMNNAGGQGVELKFMPGSFVYISAQNEGAYGEVTCRITVDGMVMSENTSSADYGIASCDARVR